MIIGSVVPVILLVSSEWILYHRKFIDSMYLAYISQRENKENDVDIVAVKQMNCFTQKVLGLGITVAGIVVILLGMVTEEDRVVPIAIGLIILVLGGYLLLKARK